MAPPDGAGGPGGKDNGDGDEDGAAVRIVRAAWENATVWQPEADDVAPPLGEDDYGFADDGDGREGVPDQPSPGLPDDCPVVPLGTFGRTYYFLDRLRQLQEIAWKDLQRSQIIGLFQPGARDYLRRIWPRKTQNKNTLEWETTGWAPDEAQFDLSEACAVKGVWNPRARVRGAGAWKAIDGALILHCGDRVFRFPAGGGKPGSDLPGEIGEHVYPAAPPVPRPWGEAQTASRDDGPAWRLLAILKTWNWARPGIDPALMVGWICAGMIGGALKFRPMIWIPGEHGTGKSSLQDLIKWLMGTTGLLSVANASAAGIQQTLGYSSLPAALDEQEASVDNRKVTAVLELAREAATGAVRVRGGSDHNAASFNIQSAFAFSSILIPPMEPQDVSRFAVLDLRQLPPGSRPPAITEEGMNKLGRQLLRRLVDGWPRFAATLDAYREALMHSGKHSGRGADLFGTLLACADLALSDTLPSQDILAKWAGKLDATKLAELEGARSDKQECLDRLTMSTLVDQHNRRERSVAEWAARANGMQGVTEEERLHCNRILALHGLKWFPKDEFHYLAVSNNHPGVSALFKDSKWAGGVWRQSLGRLAGAILGHQVKLPPNSRCVLVPLCHFLSDVPAPPAARISAAGSAPGEVDDSGEVLDAAGDRSAADASSYDQSAAGASPGEALASGTMDDVARDRSAADTACDPSSPPPDPFSLSDDFSL